MQIYLARHGQSRWQVTHEDGDWDSPLTELGEEQAQRLADWLTGPSGLAIGHIRCSPLLRAQQTAQPISVATGLALATDEHLREADFLVSDHLPFADSPYQARPSFTANGEYARFRETVRLGWNALIKDAAAQDGPVLAVAHGGFISTLLRLVVDNDWLSFWIYNASLHLLEWKRGRWHVVLLNQWDHLPPAKRTF